MLEALAFQAAPTGEELIRAIEILKAMGAEGRRKVPAAAPSGFIPPRWQKAMGGPAAVDGRAWVLCLLSDVPGAACRRAHGDREPALHPVGRRALLTPGPASTSGVLARRTPPARRRRNVRPRRQDELHALTEEVLPATLSAQPGTTRSTPSLNTSPRGEP